MSFSTVLSAMRHRWYVVAIALLAAVGAFTALSGDGGTYTTKTVVSFLVPAATSLSPDNGSGDRSVIAFARSVAAAVNSDRHPVSYSEDSAPYYGAGVRQGVLVVVPSDGNQWYESYSHAEIDIQIVGRTRRWVEQQQGRYVAAILAAAKSQQSALVSNPAQYLTASVVPLTRDITEIVPDRTSQAAAMAALLLGALLVGTWGAVTWDRRRLGAEQAVVRPSRRSGSLSLKDSMT